MKNREIAHQWAHGASESGHGSHFYFEGAVIYSYGAHFPIARLFEHSRTGKQCVLFTSRGYSSSTARHKSYVSSACSHLDVYEVADVMNQATDERAMLKLEAEKAQREADCAAARVKENERQEARAAKLLARSPEILADWLSGKRASLPRQLNSAVLLRRSGDDMETSKGARVPIAEAEKAFRFCAKVRSWGWHRNGQQFAIGHYQLDAVNEFGVIAGCHRVAWSEVDRFAKAEGWAA